MSLNDFEIGKELGKGAFGSVYIVKRKQDNKIYAMKQVKIVGLSKKERNNAFNEVRILASLSHKNIIGYKEAFYDKSSETLNIVMEYADDGDLNTKIKKNIKNKTFFEEDVIWKTLIQILEGLKYLHQKCIIHRDLKSANIFLTKKGIIKIGDLNVSKIIKRMGMASTQTGTPYFASPEIWNNQPYDYKCDVWSAGCIIYEMTSYHVPFRAGSMRELYNNIMKGIYPTIPSRYSEELRKIIKKIIVVNPELRPSANELLNCNIIKQKMKELNFENENDYNHDKKNYGENIEEENPSLMNTIKIPFNINQINKKLPKKNYETEKKKENDISLNNRYDSSKINHNLKQDKQEDSSNKINNIYYNRPIYKILKEKKEHDININRNYYNKENKPIQNKNVLSHKKFKSILNNNENILSKILNNNDKYFKINNITNLINNNIIIVNNQNHNTNINNNNEYKSNNNTLEIDSNNNNTNKNVNSIFQSNNDKNGNNQNKNLYFNKNSIPYNNKKIPIFKNNNQLFFLNKKKYDAIKTDINPNSNSNTLPKYYNYSTIDTNQINNEIMNDFSFKKQTENNKIYSRKSLIQKRSYSSNNFKNIDNSNNNTKYKNNSLRINIPLSDRARKRRMLKQQYSHSNIYNNSLSIDRINNNISTINNDNDKKNISYFNHRIRLNLESEKNLQNKKLNYFEEKYKSIITDKNNFNNYNHLLNRNKNYQLSSINFTDDKNRNKFSLNHSKLNNNINENVVNTDNNLRNIQKESNIIFLNDDNNFKMHNNKPNYKHIDKKVINNLQKLLSLNNLNNKEKTDNNPREKRIIASYDKKPKSYRLNYCNSFESIKNKIFNENSTLSNNLTNINNISNIHQRNSNQENDKNDIINPKLKENKYSNKFIDISSKKNKFLNNIFLPKPKNNLKDKFKLMINNPNYFLNSKNSNDKDKNKSVHFNKNEQQFNLFDLNNSKEKNSINNIDFKTEKYHNNYINKIIPKKYHSKANLNIEQSKSIFNFNNNNDINNSSKNNNLHKIICDKIYINNNTEVGCEREQYKLSNINQRNSYNNYHKDNMRNKNEMSKQLSEFNIHNFIL